MRLITGRFYFYRIYLCPGGKKKINFVKMVARF